MKTELVLFLELTTSSLKKVTQPHKLSSLKLLLTVRHFAALVVFRLLTHF